MTSLTKWLKLTASRIANTVASAPEGRLGMAVSVNGGNSRAVFWCGKADIDRRGAAFMVHDAVLCGPVAGLRQRN
ncbi:hypothetical protein GCM10010837_48730 [Aminobacter niigataensis]